MGRKRPRSYTDDDDEQQQFVDPIDESESAQDTRDGSRSQPDANGSGEQEIPDDDDSEERERELDVWESFKEEHHEVLEQLPLSLHRQFKLIRELDAQGEVFHTDLLASVRRYIQLRESLAARKARGDANHAEGAQPVADNVNHVGGEQNGTSPDAMQVDGTEHTHVHATARSPKAFQPKPGETTRTLLQHIAQTSEEAIRAAEEKVNIAQTAYETVDRQMRLLDQAIKEQEAAISLGVRPGTHLAPILLPDLIVPRWARPPRVEHSPVPSLSPEPGLYAEEPPALEFPPPQVPSPKAPKKGKKVTAHKPAKPEKEEPLPPAAGAGEELAMTTRTRRTSVRLTIPAQPVVEPSVPADPNETRYCYCNQVSFGTMIACDNEGCKLEWFHLGCTGLLEVPSKKTKWYCRECKPKMTQKGRPKTS